MDAFDADVLIYSFETPDSWLRPEAEVDRISKTV